MTGIYLHIPFCVKKCFYCDFYSEELILGNESRNDFLINYNPKIINQFVDFLITEIQLRDTDYTKSLDYNTIFFGGGTPSLLSSEHFKRIFDTLHKHYNILSDAEITIECNPKTTTLKKFQSLKSIGVNRLSFGVQSFIPEELEFLQRIHGSEDVVREIGNARIAGFDNISLDLMFSLPNQTRENVEYSLNRGIVLNPDHISAYSLIYEPDTPLFDEYEKGLIKKIDDDNDAELYQIVQTKMIENGYLQYEVSNFTQKDKKCLHNINYWEGGEYLSFGPSAHGYLQSERYWNFRKNTDYFSKLSKRELPTETSENIDNSKKLTELIFLGLRSQGVDLQRINKLNESGLSDKFYKYINILSDEKLLEINQDFIFLTTKGYLICDEIVLNIINIIS